MDTYKPAEYSSPQIFALTRQIVVAAAMLLALTLAAPPRGSTRPPQNILTF